MLTRHLYRIDEVKASCKLTLTLKNYREALFWSLELIDTLMEDDLRSIMIDVWFESVGHISYPLLLDVLETDDLLGCVGAFCSVGRDASIFTLMALGCLDWKKQPDRVVPSSKFANDALSTCILRAIRQGKVVFAWTLLRCNWSWDLIPVDSRLIALKEYGWRGRAAALISVCGKKFAWKPIKKYIDEALYTEWTSLEGRRERRVYKIRPILYGTERSICSRSLTNIQEVREPLTALHGSPYWDAVAEEFGGWRPIYKNDESKEAFYELYFPDDIPDEWSTGDQEKSHGLGFAFDEQTDEDRRQKALRSSLYTIPSFGLVSLTHDAIKICPVDYDSQQKHWAQIQSAWTLSPARKKIVLVPS